MIIKCPYDGITICRNCFPQDCEDCEAKERADYLNAKAELESSIGSDIDLMMKRCKCSRREVLLIAAQYVLDQAELDQIKYIKK